MRTFLLNRLYGQAISGLPLLGTPAETAARHLATPGSLTERADRMAQTHLALCTSTGFVCGLGGLLTLPITLPANVVGVALLQLHLGASVAFLGGRDVNDKQTRAEVVRCLLGPADEQPDRDEAQEVTDRAAVKIAERLVRVVAETAVGVATSATRSVLTARLPRRSLPLIGGVIGGTSDFRSTQRVIVCAYDAFLRSDDQPLDTPLLA